MAAANYGTNATSVRYGTALVRTTLVPMFESPRAGTSKVLALVLVLVVSAVDLAVQWTTAPYTHTHTHTQTHTHTLSAIDPSTHIYQHDTAP